MAQKLEISIVGDPKSYQRALKDSGKATKSFGSTLGSLGKIGLVAAGGGIAAIGIGLKKSVEAAKDAEVSQRRMATALDAMGLNYKKNAGHIDEVIQKQSKLAALDDEDLQDSFTNIARATGDVSKALQLNALAADIARGKGVDLAVASKAVAKAAGGNANAFSRLGIAMAKGTTATEAIAIAQKKFSGQARSFGESAAGGSERFHVALENIQETLGAKLLPVLATVGTAAADFITKLSESEALKNAIAGIGDTLASIGPAIKTGLEVATGALQALRGPAEAVFGFLKDNAPVVAAVAGAIGAMGVAWGAYAAATAVAAAAQAALNVVMLANPIGVVALAIAGLVGGMVVLYQRSQTTRDIVNGAFNSIKAVVLPIVATLTAVWQRFGDDITRIARVAFQTIKRVVGDELDAIKQVVLIAVNLIQGDWGGAWKAMKRLVGDVLDAIGALLSGALTIFGTAAAALGRAIVDGMTAALSFLGGKVTEALGAVKTAIASVAKSAPGWAAGIGEGIVGGIVSGLSELAGRVAHEIISKVLDGINAAKHFFHIGSPSLFTMREIGIPLGEGILEGIRRMQPDIDAALSQQLARTVTGSPTPRTGNGVQAASLATAGATELHIHVEGPVYGIAPEKWVRDLWRQLEPHANRGPASLRTT